MKATSVRIDDPQWSEFTASHPDATPFHLPSWAGAIEGCYGFEALALVVKESDGEIVAGVPAVLVRSPLGPRRLVSLPFSDHCPPLVLPGVEIGAIADALCEHVTTMGVREFEVRSTLPGGTDRHPAEVGYRQVVQLPSDPQELHPRKNHRNARNRARRNGVRVIRGTTLEDVMAYYRLHTLTRHRLGVPVQPRRFFELIWDRLLRTGHGFVATAELDGEIIAAGLYLAHNGTLVAKFGASDPARPDTGAGYLVDWETMSAACIDGYHTLDLGRTDLGADGLRLYKSGWGAVEEPLVYTHVAQRAPAAERPRVGGFAQGVIRRSPVWVCRALGEVLYRWSA